MNLWDEGQKLTQSGISFVVVTLTHVRGSAPQDPGAKIIVTKEGLYAGTVGGGKVEMAAIKKCITILESSKQMPPEVVSWNLQKDIGMSCGGESSFLFEHYHQTHWPIVIFGAGHVSQAVTRLLSKLSCHLICVDSRIEWIEKLEGIKTIHHSDPKTVVSQLDPKSFFFMYDNGSLS